MVGGGETAGGLRAKPEGAPASTAEVADFSSAAAMV